MKRKLFLIYLKIKKIIQNKQSKEQVEFWVYYIAKNAICFLERIILIMLFIASFIAFIISIWITYCFIKFYYVLLSFLVEKPEMGELFESLVPVIEYILIGYFYVKKGRFLLYIIKEKNYSILVYDLISLIIIMNLYCIYIHIPCMYITYKYYYFEAFKLYGLTDPLCYEIFISYVIGYWLRILKYLITSLLIVIIWRFR